MNRTIRFVIGGLSLLLLTPVTAQAAPLFVATAQNFRGVMFTGYGPGPDLAARTALAACAQHSVLPPTCRVIDIHVEAPLLPPPMAIAPMPKYNKSAAKPKSNYKYKSSSRKYEDGSSAYESSSPKYESTRPRYEGAPSRAESAPGTPESTSAKAKSGEGKYEGGPSGPPAHSYQWGRAPQSN